MINDINNIIQQLETISVLPKAISKELSLVKLYRSLYSFCGEKAFPQLEEQYQKLMESLYKEFKSYPFYSDTPLCRLLQGLFDPQKAYVEPWGYDSTYSSI